MDRQLLEKVIRNGLGKHGVENAAAVAGAVADGIEMALEMEADQTLPEQAPRARQEAHAPAPPIKSPILTPSDPGFRAIMIGQSPAASPPKSMPEVPRVAGGPREIPQLLKELEDLFPPRLALTPDGSEREIVLERNIIAMAALTTDADPDSASGGAKVLYAYPGVSHMEVSHLFLLGEAVQVDLVLQKIAQQAKALYRSRDGSLPNSTPIRPGDLTFKMDLALPHDSV